MQRKLHTAQGCMSIYRYIGFVNILCCLAFLLASSSGCAMISPPTDNAATVSAKNASSHAGSSAGMLQRSLAVVHALMQNMSLDQKLGQLLLVEYLGNSYQRSDLQAMITEQYVGGFMYQESNRNFEPPYNDISSVNAFSYQAQSDAQIPLLIATDQEGGLVNRLFRFHGALPSAQEMAKSGDPQVASVQGMQFAQWMQELGMNADLAPVVDVRTVDPSILQSRIFGRDPDTVATYAGAFLDGLQANHVAGCLKHFPGLGAITSDPHNGLPIVPRSMDELSAIDLAPYKLMIPAKKPAMVMSTDVLMPAIDPDLPAELSPKAINGLLRGELKYGGVVITDELYMRGITVRSRRGEAAVLASVAGNVIVEGA